MLRNPLRRRGKKTFWFLVDDHGTPLSKHKTHEEAERAYTELVAVDPAAADEVAVIRVDS